MSVSLISSFADRMCDYQYYNGKYLPTAVSGHGYYMSLASAQQACSRLGTNYKLLITA